MSRSKNRNRNKNNTNTVVLTPPCKFNYTKRLETLLLEICDDISFAIMGSHGIENTFGYRLLDLSDEKGIFRAYIDDRTIEFVTVKEFVRTFFDGKFTERETDQFITQYDKRLIDVYDDLDYTLVDVTPYEETTFVYKPKDILYTFHSLCYQTYPFGTEDAILKYIPIPLEMDFYGNYFTRIGDSDVMFTSHFDSACKEHEKVKLMTFEKGGCVFSTSGTDTILSADDKSGVTVMLYMIEHNVPGLYYFFLGEERGGIGSGLIARDFKTYDHLEGINKCISFDRRNYYSVITHQTYTRCCSDIFAESLCAELNKNGLNMKPDNTGIFTDSANFVEHIAECTNISVGYFNEHSHQEYQNITFLEQLCKACVNIDWNALEITRKIGINREIIDRNYDMLMDFKTLKFFSDVKLRGYEDRIFIQVKMSSPSFDENYEDISEINNLFDKWNLNPYIYFTDEMDGAMLMNIEIE